MMLPEKTNKYNLDLDPFESAILKDLLVEWTTHPGTLCIPALPSVITGEVRETLIRLEAWRQLIHEPVLFMLFQGTDYQAFNDVEEAINRYHEFSDVTILQIDADDCEEQFQAAKEANQKIIIVIPIEAFGNLTPEQVKTGILPHDTPWRQYQHIIKALNQLVPFPLLVYYDAHESAFMNVPTSYITTAIIIDKLVKK